MDASYLYMHIQVYVRPGYFHRYSYPRSGWHVLRSALYRESVTRRMEPRAAEPASRVRPTFYSVLPGRCHV